jgi:hypothetical protein
LAKEGAWNWCGIACLYIFRPDVQTKYGLPIFDVTLSLRENICQFFWASPGQQKIGAPWCRARRPEKIWWQVEKFGLLAGVYIYPGWMIGQNTSFWFQQSFPSSDFLSPSS